jgi:putative ABC transport system permease protein
MNLFRFFHRKRSDAELQNEIEAFLSEETADNVARGMSPDEARRQARIKLGNPLKVRESLWTQNSPLLLPHVGHDLKYAFRTLSRAPGFSIIAIVVVALCIGAATSLFTVVRSVLLRPLPFRDPARLVMVYEHFRGGEFSYHPVAPADFYDWRSKTHGFEDMAIMRPAGYNLTGVRNELPESVGAEAGSSNLFSLLGVQPALGRDFMEADDQRGSAVVMLTWSVFERRFAGDAKIVGGQIHLDGKPYTVVGVLPSWFTYPDAGVQLWVPYKADASPEMLQHHDWHGSYVVARLRPDVSPASAITQVGAIQYQLHLQYPHDPVAEDVVSRSLNEDLAGDVKKPLTLMLSAVGCMLLIGCLNVANLLVARGAARQKEVAIRSALGAQRATLIREQMAESVLICAAGGVGGILLSLGATEWLAKTWKDLPTAQSIHIDGAVITFACALMFAAALIAGLLPALSTTGKSMLEAQTSVRTGSSSVSRTALRKSLLTAEIGITVVLLMAAGLLLKSFMQLRAANVGCVVDNTLTLQYNLPGKNYDTPDKRNAFNEALLAQVRAMPGVRGAALGTTVPGTGYWGTDEFTVKEHAPLKTGENLPDALTRWVEPGYFSALGIPLVSGRFFTRDERVARSYKVIVSRQLVQQYFAGENPIGKHLHVPARAHDGAPNLADWEIVGVIGDTLYQVGKEPKATMYFPILEGRSDATLAVHTATDHPLQFSVPLQKQIASLDPELPVSHVLTMNQIIGASLVNASLSATLVMAFAVLSLILASVGLYGVLSYLTTQRTSELGIRIALGAQRDQLLQLMLMDGLRPALFGLGLGLVMSFAATRIFQSMLFGTKPLDPVVLSGVIATLLAVAVLACLAPAWRASRLDPMKALRTE